MIIYHIDHVVLTVANIERSAHFYQHVMGFTLETFRGMRTALKFGDQKINLHQLGHEFEPKAFKPLAGSADLCFIATTNLDEVIRELAAKGVPIEVGPVERTGARGKIRSIYIRDPDRNLIEISNYTGG